MSQYSDGPNKTFKAGATIGANIRVTLTAGVLQIADASTIELGTTIDRVVSGDYVAVRLRNAQGTRKFTANGAITYCNICYAAAAGKVASSGTVICGLALETTTTDGDVFEAMSRGANDTTSDSGTTAATFTVDNDSSAPKIQLSGHVDGSGDYTTTLTPEHTLSGNNTIIVPEADGDVLAAVALAQTLTNKTLTSPVVNTPVVVKTNEAHTAGDTLTVAESGSVHTNAGASGTITIVLPAATVGQEFLFVVKAAYELRIDPNTTQTIALPSTGAQGSAGAYLTADAVGEYVRLYCAVTGTWDCIGYFGTWAAV